MEEIDKLRKKINKLDRELIELIAERSKIAAQIGMEKKKIGLKIKDIKREKSVLLNLEILAKDLGVSPEYINKIWRLLIKISYEVEGEKNGNS